MSVARRRFLFSFLIALLFLYSHRVFSARQIQAVTSAVIHIPGPVKITQFITLPGDSNVFIIWATESETDTAGFNVYRADVTDGEYRKINNALIPAEGAAVEGASYEYIDREAKNRTAYYYKLEDIDRSGKRRLHGPVSAAPRFMYAKENTAVR